MIELRLLKLWRTLALPRVTHCRDECFPRYTYVLVGHPERSW